MAISTKEYRAKMRGQVVVVGERCISEADYGKRLLMENGDLEGDAVVRCRCFRFVDTPDNYGLLGQVAVLGDL